MKNHIFKKIILSLVLSITFMSANAYTYEEVVGACANAYEADDQLEACVANVCREYGCE